MDDSPSLAAATTDEIIDELQRRYPHVIAAGVRPADNGEAGDVFMIHYRGGFTTCIGIAHRARTLLTRFADEEAGHEADDA